MPERDRKERTFVAARGAFTGDFKVAVGENPKSSNGIAVTVTGTATHDLNIIAGNIDSTHLL